MIGFVTKPQAFELCLEIDEELPGAVIFGGFWRDVLLQKPVSDIDIAVPTNVFALESMGFELQEYDSDAHEYDHDRIERTWRRGDLNVCEVSDVVSPQTQNEYVDVGLCAVAWDTRTGLVVDNAFLKDSVNKTLTVRRKGWGEAGVEAHLKRLKEKFPDYKVVRS